MFSRGTQLSFSKLKFLSHLMDCSVSSLKCNGKSRGLHLLDRAFVSKVHFPARYFSSEVSSGSPFEGVNLQGITKGDDNLLKKLQVIILEADVMRQEGMKVPSNISDDKWVELLNVRSKSQRMKLLNFWWLNEKRKEKDKQKKEEARLKKEELYRKLDEEPKTDHIEYGFRGSTIFIRVTDTTIDRMRNNKLYNAMKFGQNLVIDCGYGEHMNAKEASLCASQLKIIFADNRLRREPFNIHLCSANREDHIFKKFHKLIPTLYDDTFPLNISKESYLELFPKERLVYLTPHCREELLDYNHDDIYIVGALVDMTNTDPVSLGKAKSQGLRMARLPLERYLDWGIGGKSLTINQVVDILHEMKDSGDWMQALKHVPRRKIKNESFERRHGSSPRKRVINYKALLSV